MKSIKFFALAIGAIVLLPSVSLADNINGTNQEANLKSVTVGSGNVTVQDVQQRTINLQNSGTPCQTDTPCSTPFPTSGTSGSNVGGTSLKVNADTTTIGNQNVDIKKVIQEAINIQQAK